jgi:hypothetical protein
MREKKMVFGDDEFDSSKDIIRNRLKQDLYSTILGDREGYRIALELDSQVQKAVELIPQAQTLAQNSIARRR